MCGAAIPAGALELRRKAARKMPRLPKRGAAARCRRARRKLKTRGSRTRRQPPARVRPGDLWREPGHRRRERGRRRALPRGPAPRPPRRHRRRGLARAAPRQIAERRAAGAPIQ